MGKKLYVGGISYTTTQEGLQAAFAECGEVEEATIIMDRMSGRSKGFGFVTMATDEGADAAIAKWDGQELDGRRIKVNEARPMEERAPRSSSGGSRGGYSRDRF